LNYEDIISAIHSGTLDQIPVNDIIDVLVEADDMYHNGEEESFLSDAEYDALRRYAERVAPHDVYFTGVGSDVRSGKQKLPYPMGSLDQIYEGEITGWVADNGLREEYLINTDKLDGTSAEVLFNLTGDLQIAFSRGNGFEGADITRHVKQLPTVPTNVGRQLVVRGEMIIEKSRFPEMQQFAVNRAGRPYKNARNAVAGIMNAKKNDLNVYKYVDFVAYEIIGSKLSKEEQLLELNKLGFKTPTYALVKGIELNDSFLADYLNSRRAVTEYEIDGIVIDVNSSMRRKALNPTRDTLNPAYSVKYKIADASNQAIATVLNVEWNASKDSYLKPRIEIEPVELVGVTIRHATGFNAKFIVENSIGPGAKVLITRSGDVIPFIQKVIEPADEPQMPDVECSWNETQVDLIADEETDEVHINRLIDFFSSIDAPMLREGNIRTLYEAGYNTTESIIRMSLSELDSLIGSNGKKIYEGLREKLTDIPQYVLMGSTHFFGRGVGKRKFKKLLKAIGEVTQKTIKSIPSVEGFDEKTAAKIEAGIESFNSWFESIKDYVTVAQEAEATSSTLEGEKVVFTGFRDKDLEAAVEAAGGSMQSSVSSKTTILVTVDPTSNSGKIKKARDLGIKIIGVDAFKEMVK